MSIVRFAAVLGVLTLIFYLLAIGKTIFLPIVIAIVVWYLIITLAGEFRRTTFFGLQIPRWIATSLALITISIVLTFLVRLINTEIIDVIKEAPIYETKIQALFIKLQNQYGIIDIKNILSSIQISTIFKALAGAFTNIAGSAGMIFIYVLLLLLEYRTFDVKFKALFPDPKHYRRVNNILTEINKDINTYIRIKIFISFCTALLSYVVLISVGVDFASFWAILIFLLNFIPTVGSIVATIFPIALTLLQFESIYPFVIVAILLISIQIAMGNILEPRFMGNSLNLSPLIIIISLALWGSIWGVTGMFLCVPIMVIINIILSKFPSTRSIAILLSARGQI